VPARDAALIVALGVATLVPFLGQRHDVGTHELLHAEIAREMAATGRVLVPVVLGHEYANKPPVMHAMIAGLFRLAGEPSLRLARVPSAVAAIVAALALYGIGVVVMERRAALLGALVLLGSFEPHRMARIARPDTILVAAILVSCWALVRALDARARRGSVAGMAVAGVAAGAAVVTKGPLGIAVPALFALLAPLGCPRVHRPRVGEWALFAAGAALAVGAWVAALRWTGHADYLHRVVTQPDVSGADPAPGAGWTYVGAAALGFVPFTLLLPLVVRDVRRRGWTVAAALPVVLIVALSLVPKKRPHYLLPAYPFLALAIADAVSREPTSRGLRLATTALVVAALGAAPLYYAIVTSPALSARREEAKLVVARRVLDSVEPGHVVVATDELAEAIAFEGRRDGVVHVNDVSQVVHVARTNGTGSYLVVPEGYAEALERAARGRVDLARMLDAEAPVGRRMRRWRLYRVRSVRD
jgi:4-amino-4-deoxy-L-arabinose transferase-like glycosyltransferase